MKESRRDGVEIADLNGRVNVLLHVDQLVNVVFHKVGEQGKLCAKMIDVCFDNQIDRNGEKIISGEKIAACRNPFAAVTDELISVTNDFEHFRRAEFLAELLQRSNCFVEFCVFKQWNQIWFNFEKISKFFVGFLLARHQPLAVKFILLRAFTGVEKKEARVDVIVK